MVTMSFATFTEAKLCSQFSKASCRNSHKAFCMESLAEDFLQARSFRTKAGKGTKVDRRREDQTQNH